MQKSESPMPLPIISSPEKQQLSETSSPLGYLLDIESICQRQIEQMLVQLPIVAIWIVFRNWKDQTRQLVERCQQNQPGFDPEVLSYLESEVWLQEDLPPRQLIQLAFPWQDTQPKMPNGKVARRKIGHQDGSNIFVYVYLLGEEEETDEYWLLWTDEPLSLSQQQKTEQQAQTLSDRLTLVFECYRQQEEIQLLEQVVRRGEHQLRHSLALIGLYAENLYLGLPSGIFQEQATIIRETVKELSANLTNLLACSQQAKLQLSPHDLREILFEVLIVLQPKLEEKQLYVQYPTTPASLIVDRWQMKQVFENLLSNAIDFSPVGEIITCDWRVFHNEILVEICDRGLGLSQEDLKHAFTPFYSRRPGGTGMGLTIARKIILDHQGSIWVQNLPRGGAKFSFSLPRRISHPSDTEHES
ncbi:MAG TPA: HAMP domain-containing sensor histidine kinase [Coleofasciculaceae cyanobacterium]